MEKNVESILRGSLFKALMGQQLEAICNKYDLRRVDIEVLYYLTSNSEANTAGDIKRCLKINKGYISQVLDRLCKQGYVEAVQDKEDKRYVHYLLTKKTDDLVEQIKKIWRDMENRIFKGISEEEQQELKRIAIKIQNNIREVLSE